MTREWYKLSEKQPAVGEKVEVRGQLAHKPGIKIYGATFHPNDDREDRSMFSTVRPGLEGKLEEYWLLDVEEWRTAAIRIY